MNVDSNKLEIIIMEIPNDNEQEREKDFLTNEYRVTD